MLKIYNINIFIPIIIELFLITFFSFFNSHLCNKLNFKDYDSAHKIHNENISRLGGLCILIFFIYLIFVENTNLTFINKIIICFIPIFIITLKEDLYHNTKPIFRLVCIFISSFFCLYFLNFPFPYINLPILNLLFDNVYFNLIFYAFSISIVVNGFNFIDGTNGLSLITGISILLSLFLVSLKLDDIILAKEILIISAPLIAIFFFNYPFGKIFIGDLGSYLLGFIISTIVILFFFRHPEIKTWGAVLILFYPSFEVLFSFIRKTKSKLSPFSADSNHLHTLVFKYLKKEYFNSKISNPLVLIIGSFLWFLPALCFYFFYNDLNFIFISFFLCSAMYIIFYKFLFFKLEKDF